MFQLEVSAAEAYEANFVPAVFAEWAQELVVDAGISPGERVLDVACGTGIVARKVADTTAAEITGVDINPAMLEVARRVRPELSWGQADAGALPFPDRAFDKVLCQMALMFFPDPTAALREMARVTADGGSLAVVVPGRLEEQPVYGPFVELASRHADADAMSLLGAYFSCGDLERLRQLFESAGLAVTGTRTHVGTANNASAEQFVVVEVESTPLADRLDEEQYASLRFGAARVLAPFTASDGSVAAPLQGHIVIACKA
ncbi:class I SAM-dependent methyltransferase [Paeniglutamicibacter psychrophenolicus]